MHDKESCMLGLVKAFGNALTYKNTTKTYMKYIDGTYLVIKLCHLRVTTVNCACETDSCFLLLCAQMGPQILHPSPGESADTLKKMLKSVG